MVTSNKPKKINLSKLLTAKSFFGQKCPWTNVSLDNSLLGPRSPWTNVPWTNVLTPFLQSQTQTHHQPSARAYLIIEHFSFEKVS